MSRCQNLMEPLEQVTAPYRNGAVGRQPESAAAAQRGVAELDDYLGLSRDELGAVRDLDKAVAALRGAVHLAGTLPQVVEAAMTLMDAEYGNVQLVDPLRGSLVLVAQCGFGPGFVEHFAVVRDDHTVCGQAARQSSQAVVADVRVEPVLEPHWEVFRVAGVRAVQSTPMVEATGRVIGIVSTHSSRARRPSELDLMLMRSYGRFAGEAVARLLDPRSQERGPVRPGPAQTDSPMERVMSDTVNRLWSAGMRLSEAQRDRHEDGTDR